MGFFSKRNIDNLPYDFSNLHQDIHSHILPGIDDGSPDLQTSIALLKALTSAGIHTFICTPHVIGDMFRNTPETINAALDLLKKECQRQNIQVALSAAAEYMLDDYFMDLLRKRKPLLTLADNFILTELSYATSPNNLEKISFEINVQGYQPLMAHPERYFYYHKNYDAYYRMKELGFLLQVNLLSLTGYYGKPAAKAAHFILDNGLASFIGTDLHNMNHFNVLTDVQNASIFRKALKDTVYNDFKRL